MTAIVVLTCLSAASTGGSRGHGGTATEDPAVGATIRAAEHAFDSGQIDEAVELYRRVLSRYPGNERAFEGILEASKNRSLPRDSEAFRAARQALPRGFVIHETARFVVLSDADSAWTRNQAERLERAHHQFMRFAKLMSLRPLPLQHKLVAVLFRDRDEYRRFAREQDGVMSPNMSGYYAPTADRLVFYDVESNPDLADARERLEQMQQEIEDYERQLRMTRNQRNSDHDESLREELNRFREHHAAESARINAFAQQMSTSTTIHEAIHQLMFHTRIQSPHVQHPVWLSEGLATAFETDSPNEAFGPQREYEPRRNTFAELLAVNQVMPLTDLVSKDRVVMNSDRAVEIIYHQSYSLITWICRFRKDELRAYLNALNSLPPGVPTRTTYIRLFEESFGEIDRIERAWLRSEISHLSLAVAANWEHRLDAADAAAMAGIPDPNAGLFGELDGTMITNVIEDGRPE